ncbi:MAG: lipase family protein [Bacteroidota bacterium]|nr:lipase family protein [Bacteroidota bacterium]
MLRLKIILTILITFSLLTCNKKNDLPAPAVVNQPIPLESLSVLVDTHYVGRYTPQQIISSIPVEKNIFINAIAKFPIIVYSIEYRTKNYNDSLVIASGLIAIPENQPNLSLLSYQHGTILQLNEITAPSHFSPNTEAYFVALMATNGYLTCAADYIGYGSTKNLPHPYEHAKSLATTCTDMVKATQELAKVLFISTNGKTFLTGYSEGGFATIATQKLIEEKYTQDIKLSGVTSGAGGYDNTAFAKYIVSQNKELPYLNYYVWVLQTYNQIYKLGKPDSFYFKKEYAKVLINNPFGAVSNNPSVLFTDSLINGILNGTNTSLMNAFKDNDLIDWAPKTPVLLIHGELDDFVPPFNSKNAYQGFIKNGSTAASLKIISGANHNTTFESYAIETFSFISKY